MKRNFTIASPALARTPAAEASQTQSKSSRVRRSRSTDIPERLSAASQAKPSPKAKHGMRSSLTRVSSSPNRVHPVRPLKLDPYSLSDVDDDDNQRGKPKMTRKRKHASAFTAQEPPSNGLTGDVQRTTTRTPRTRSKPSSQPSSVNLPGQSQSPGVQRDAPMTGLYQSSPQRRRPRLIDTLAAQKTGRVDVDPDGAESAGTGDDADALPHSMAAKTNISASRSLLPQEANMHTTTLSPRKTASSSATGTKVKATYSQSRTIAAKSLTWDRNTNSSQDDTEATDPLASPLAFPSHDPFEDELDETPEERRGTIKVKGIHELRRAGANMRFTDELGDLLLRIGLPGPDPSIMRRNALLELAEKLRRPGFADQFRDHTDRDAIVQQLGNEEDVISGFALLAVLVEFLSERPAPHLLHTVAAEGAGKLVGKLLQQADDISMIASWRETNLPRQSQTTIRAIRSHLIDMDIWMGYTMRCLSPRTIALKMLDVLHELGEPSSLETIWGDCLENLLAIVDVHAEKPVNDGVDLALAVTIFEVQSNVAREASREAQWLQRHCSTAFYLIRTTLDEWSSAGPRTRLAALKMAINVTNTVFGATEFSNARLLADLSARICFGVEATRESVACRNFDKEGYDGLVLMLGVMINIQEHCSSARESIPRQSIERLASVYAENRLVTREADSEEKSRLSVALGYLAVLLGYLCLNGPGLSVISDEMGREGFRGLRVSIREFIDVYKHVDSKVQDLEGLVSELQARFV